MTDRRADGSQALWDQWKDPNSSRNITGLYCANLKTWWGDSSASCYILVYLMSVLYLVTALVNLRVVVRAVRVRKIGALLDAISKANKGAPKIPGKRPTNRKKESINPVARLYNKNKKYLDGKARTAFQTILTSLNIGMATWLGSGTVYEAGHPLWAIGVICRTGGTLSMMMVLLGLRKSSRQANASLVRNYSPNTWEYRSVHAQISKKFLMFETMLHRFLGGLVTVLALIGLIQHRPHWWIITYALAPCETVLTSVHMLWYNASTIPFLKATKTAIRTIHDSKVSDRRSSSEPERASSYVDLNKELQERAVEKLGKHLSTSFKVNNFVLLCTVIRGVLGSFPRFMSSETTYIVLELIFASTFVICTLAVSHMMYQYLLFKEKRKRQVHCMTASTAPTVIPNPRRVKG